MTNNSFMSKLAVAAVLSGLFFVGCKSDSSNNPKPSDDGGVAGTSGNAGTGGKGGTGGGKAGTSGGKAGTSGSAGNGSDNDSGVVDAGGDITQPDMCIDTAHNDCIKCDPTTTNSSVEFLNHCTAATCQPFDNTKLTAIVGGVLPAIP